MGHYKVYNFANEPGRSYPAQLFEGRVERCVVVEPFCLPLHCSFICCARGDAVVQAGYIIVNPC